MFSIDLELPVSICSAWAEILPLQVVLPEVFFPPEGVLAQVFYDIHWYPMLWFFLPRSQQFHEFWFEAAYFFKLNVLRHHKKNPTCHSWKSVVRSFPPDSGQFPPVSCQFPPVSCQFPPEVSFNKFSYSARCVWSLQCTLDHVAGCISHNSHLLTQIAIHVYVAKEC